MPGNLYIERVNSLFNSALTGKKDQTELSDNPKGNRLTLQCISCRVGVDKEKSLLMLIFQMKICTITKSNS
jgi:hypothetical protein